MTSVRTLQRSFAGGEITPELFGRVDLDKYQTGLALCRNFIVLPHGPATARPGFEYVLETRFSSKAARLIPFTYSTQQTYVLEFGHYYVRFHTQGGTVLETAKTITDVTNADPGVVTITAHGFGIGDWLYFSGVGGMTELNGRYFKVLGVPTTDTLTLRALDGWPVDTSAYGAHTTGGTAARVYTVATPYASDHLADLQYVQSADVLTLAHPSYAPRELRRYGATSWALAVISFGAPVAAPTALTATATVHARLGYPDDEDPAHDTTYYYIVSAVVDGQGESELSPVASVANQLWYTAGNVNTLNWSAVSGASRYNIYKLQGGVYGFIGQATSAWFVDDNILPDMSVTPVTYSAPFTGAGNYPGTVSYFEQRRVFASTDSKPHHLWLTRSGTESNISNSTPVRDDDAIAVRIASREVNRIRHIVPLNDLMLLTSGGEWRVYGANSDALTPTSIAVRQTSYVGASSVAPVTTASTVLYVQDLGNCVQELAYRWESSGYVPQNLSILAPHLFDGYTITAIAYVRAPLQVLWAVRSDGVLLGLTYVPEHKIVAWHQHETDGAVESITVVPEDGVDRLYAVIRRTIGVRTVRYLERLHVREFETQADVFMVDAGDTYEGAATSTITGLHHLEGCAVKVLADGAVHPSVVVSNGTITLEQAASKVHVGLGYTCDLTTLPLSFEAQAAGSGRVKSVSRAYLRTWRSVGLAVGRDFDNLTRHKLRTTEPYDSPPSLRTEETPLLLDAGWGRDGQLCIRQSDPLPLTVVGLSLEVAFGD
jgi:hypothetical protein